MYKNHQGFTLIELIVVIALIAILAAVFIPGLTGVWEQAVNTKAISYAESVSKAINLHNASAKLNNGTIINDVPGSKADLKNIIYDTYWSPSLEKISEDDFTKALDHIKMDGEAFIVITD